jgi:hypothetical protein
VTITTGVPPRRHPRRVSRAGLTWPARPLNHPREMIRAVARIARMGMAGTAGSEAK